METILYHMNLFKLHIYVDIGTVKGLVFIHCTSPDDCAPSHQVPIRFRTILYMVVSKDIYMWEKCNASLYFVGLGFGLNSLFIFRNIPIVSTI